MRTGLWNVTTWQGKLVMNNPKNTTNKLFYYRYVFPLFLAEYEETKATLKALQREGKKPDENFFVLKQ